MENDQKSSGGRQRIHIKGMTWNHDRGLAPVLATSTEFWGNNPDVEMSWDSRPLQDFESQPIRELAEKYDMMIIDHPHLGEAVEEGLLLDLSSCGYAVELDRLAKQSVGPSHRSYNLESGQWALAVDAATPVSIYRPDRLDGVPAGWNDVLNLAKDRQVIIPLRSPHALMAFIWLARNHGYHVAQSPDFFMDADEMKSTLSQLAELTAHVHQNSFKMDPIQVFDFMSDNDNAPDYCPHGYGYVSYARDGFRKHRLQFANVAHAGGNGYSGTVLGGTGIAVSSLSDHQEIAAKYAFWIAGAVCQATLWTKSGGQAGNAVAWESDACNDPYYGFYKNTRATLEAAWLRPRYNGYLKFQADSSMLISTFLEGEISMKSCIEKVQSLYRVTRNPT